MPESSYTFRLAITGKSNGLVRTAPESRSVDGDAFPQLDQGVDFAESGHIATHHSGCVDTGSWMLVGLAGRPRLILAIVPGSIATIFFWYATTLP
jgi:hypothetical protein